MKSRFEETHAFPYTVRYAVRRITDGHLLSVDGEFIPFHDAGSRNDARVDYRDLPDYWERCGVWERYSISSQECEVVGVVEVSSVTLFPVRTTHLPGS